jgi:hypothetical protein
MKHNTRIILIIFVVFLMVNVGVYYISNQSKQVMPQTPQPTASSTPPENFNQDQSTACAADNGRWLEQYNECELMNMPIDESARRCQEMKGSFSPCESACRHDSPDGPCIAACIPVCKF